MLSNEDPSNYGRLNIEPSVCGRLNIDTSGCGRLSKDPADWRNKDPIGLIVLIVKTKNGEDLLLQYATGSKLKGLVTTYFLVHDLSFKINISSCFCLKQLNLSYFFIFIRSYESKILSKIFFWPGYFYIDLV